ncbi:MAG TPA: VWA domain-containing protein [bacterium]|nr:VWA domain-containing protein [bacterium]
MGTKLWVLVFFWFLITAGAVFPAPKEEEESKEGLSVTITSEPVQEGRENAYTVEATVKVVDAALAEVPGLGTSHFKVSDGGVDVTGLDVRPWQGPREATAAVLLIDVSWSMRDGDKIGKAKEAAASFADKISGADQIAIISFHETLNSLCGFTNDKKESRRIIEGIDAQPDKGTRLYDAVLKAARSLEDTDVKRKIVVVLTDGKDGLVTGSPRRSTTPFDLCVLDAKQRGIAVYTVGLGRDADREHLQRFADETRGQYLYSPEGEDANLGPFLASVLDRPSGSYTLTYTLPGDVVKAERIQVGKRRNLKVALKFEGVEYAASRLYEVKKLPKEGFKISSPVLIAIGAAGVLLLFGVILLAMRKPRRKLLVEAGERLPPEGPIEPDMADKVRPGDINGRVTEAAEVGPFTDEASFPGEALAFEPTPESEGVEPWGYLIIVDGPEASLKGERYALTKEIVTLGRGADQDVVLADESKVLSRRHAVIKFEQKRVTVEDAGSKNGVWVSRRGGGEFERVGSTAVTPADLIRLGPARGYIIRVEPAARKSKSDRTEILA